MELYQYINLLIYLFIKDWLVHDSTKYCYSALEHWSFWWIIQVSVQRPISMYLHDRLDLVSLYFDGFTGLIDLNLIVTPGFATAQSAFLSLKGPCWTIHPKIHPYRQFSVPWSHPWVSRTLTMLPLHLALQFVGFIIILAVFLSGWTQHRVFIIWYVV